MRSLIPSGPLPPAGSSRSVAVPGVVALPVARVPRAVWAALGGLSLLCAGLAGALVVHATGERAAPALVAQSLQQPTAVASAHADRPVPAQPVQAVRASAAGGPTAAVLAQAPAPAPARAPACAGCGTVEAVKAVQVQGEGSGLGAVAGGVAGAVVGHQFGGGTGKTALTVLGAVGGGVAGHEVEKRVRASTAYDVTVRLDDGSRRTLRRNEALAVGSRVTVQGNSLRPGTAQAPHGQRAGA